jgi:RNA polymerase sigma factor (sigma-70 family)
MTVQELQVEKAAVTHNVKVEAGSRDDDSDVDPRKPEMVDLVRSAAAGDQAAWNAIVARYSGLIWHVVRTYRLSHSDAADVVQTTWLRLVQHLERIRDPEAVGAWLATTAHRESLRVLRRASQECTTDDGFLEVVDRPEAGPEAQALVAEEKRILWRGINELSEGCQRLLRVLMTDTPMTYEQVSVMLGKPIGSIGPTRARCLECLRRVLERRAC